MAETKKEITLTEVDLDYLYDNEETLIGTIIQVNLINGDTLLGEFVGLDDDLFMLKSLEEKATTCGWNTAWIDSIYVELKDSES